MLSKHRPWHHGALRTSLKARAGVAGAGSLHSRCVSPKTQGLVLFVMHPARSRTPPVRLRDAAAYRPQPAARQLVGAAALCPRRRKSLHGRAGYGRSSRRGGPSHQRQARWLLLMSHSRSCARAPLCGFGQNA